MNLYPNSKMPKWWPNWLRSKTVASVTVHKLEVTRENISRTKLLILEAEDTLERERTELQSLMAREVRLMNHMDEWLREEEQPVPMARAFDLTPGKIAP